MTLSESAIDRLNKAYQALSPEDKAEDDRRGRECMFFEIERRRANQHFYLMSPQEETQH